MMQGTITADREAILEIAVRGLGNTETTVTTVVDTGFTDYLTLPDDTIRALGLPRTGVSQVILADGSEVDLDIFHARVVWHGQPRSIDVLAADGGPLLGMSLLYGSRLVMDILDGSAFTITPIV